VYLEDIVSRIDAPLDCISVTFPGKLRVSDIPLLRDFIGRTKIFDAPYRAEVAFSNFDAKMSLFQRKEEVDFKVLSLKIPCSIYAGESQLSSLVKACCFLPPLPSLEQLGIYKYKSHPWPSQWQNEVENTHWMDLLRPCITVKDLVLDEAVVLYVTSALQDLVRERVREILPALQNIFLEGFRSSGPFPEGIVKFIAARELSGRPVIINYRKTKQKR